MKPGISVMILTLDEEVNLQACLDSLRWSDDIVVFDSFSRDRTVEIARANGARVVQRQFDNWSSHQNWAIRNIPFKHEWVYYSDADEQVTPALAQEMLKVVAETARPEVAYRVRFKNMLMGRWLKHASLYPTWVTRLFKPPHMRWERVVNPIAAVDGPVGHLAEHFEHYTFAKGFGSWFEKHNKYAAGEAIEILKAPKIRWRDLRLGNPVRRRMVWKSLAYALPGRPVLTFLFLYLARGGFLDGRAGLTYSALRATYEFLIDVKALELRRQWGRQGAVAAEPNAVPAVATGGVAGLAKPEALTERPDCSAVILTYNEESNIKDCIASLGWCDDVVVYDSGSTDGTVRIAQEMGARVFHRAFDNYAAQRNGALEGVEYRHPWVLMLDADERVDPKLPSQLGKALAAAKPVTCLFRLRRKDYFLDRWIKSSSGFPTWFARVMRVGRVRFDRAVHEDAVVQGKTRYLGGFLIHHPFSKGVGDWFDRHNKYSSIEARLCADKLEHPPMLGLFSRDPVKRRRAEKRLAYALPFRPFLIFLYLYLAKGGVLEGQAGRIYCVLRGIYEFMIDVKVRELRRRDRGLGI